MKRLLAIYLRPHWKSVLVIAVLFALQAVAYLYLPTLNARIINNGVLTGDTGYIAKIGGYMLLFAFGQTVLAVIATYLAARTAMFFGSDVRGALYRKIQGLSQNEVNRFGTASLIMRNTNDVQQLQMMVTVALSLMMFAGMTALGAIIMALRRDLPLSLTLAVILPVTAIALLVVVWRAVPLFRSVQSRLDRINQVMRETLSGVRVIRAFARNEYEQRRFEQANRELSGVNLKIMRLFAVMTPLLWAILNLSIAGILWFGAERINKSGLSIGDLTAFLVYLAEIFVGVLMATMMLSFLPRAAASAARILEVLDVEPSVGDPAEHPVSAIAIHGPARGVVEFSHVEFRYPGAEEPVLRDISFTAQPGAVTAIVGSTGSGKSTLVSLISRLYDVTAGSITIDGRDIRDLERADLWARIGLVPETAFLFSGTVASNLRFGDTNASDDDLWHALEVAQAKEFVAAMPAGLSEPVSQGGSNLSGGQRQRLAIARALVKKAGIYIFDDSLSALDFKTDALLRIALKQEIAGATVLIVAQRVSSIMHADQIVVLDEGAVAGVGTHEELLETSEIYQEIVYSQLTADEAA